ncbi:Ig-like domain-containing protein [uncultured Porphyromonas sp.]|uniref:Ig-like domain-containing protein n=1 Tax=uncultured Porphyromonas sp. TaxID=159274 RepID=UPI0028062AF5|nr:Ig-like domain-containing protein [uncultured Porphyromonas sp.]
MKQKICLLLVALATLTLFGACNKNEEPTNDKVRLSVKPDNVLIQVGGQKQLTILTKPSGVAYSCTSSDESVATVDNKGLVTGVKGGEAVITVVAKDQTKTVNVTVLDPNAGSVNRYIGLNSPDTTISPIYIPVFSDLADSKETQKQLIAANLKYGWTLYTNEGGDEDDHKMIRMQAPKDEKGKYTDGRFIIELFYHFIKKDDVYFDCWTKPVFKKDVVKAAHEGSEEDIKVLRGLLTLYGFTENLQASKYKKSKTLNYEGYNMKQFPEGPMWGSIYCTRVDGEDSYYLEFQVVQKAPEKK